MPISSLFSKFDNLSWFVWLEKTEEQEINI